MITRFALGCVALLALLGSVAAVVSAEGPTTAPAAAAAASPLDYTVKDIEGRDVDLSQYKGKVVLIVNVASKCGLTPQYAALEALYRERKDQGLVVVAFPANDFKNQEPGSAAEISAFCKEKYDITFPLMAKVNVKGEAKAPVYKHLTESPAAGAYAGEVAWNFTKFLVGRDGQVVARFEPKTQPADPKVVEALDAALK